MQKWDAMRCGTALNVPVGDWCLFVTSNTICSILHLSFTPPSAYPASLQQPISCCRGTFTGKSRWASLWFLDTATCLYVYKTQQVVWHVQNPLCIVCFSKLGLYLSSAHLWRWYYQIWDDLHRDKQNKNVHVFVIVFITEHGKLTGKSCPWHLCKTKITVICQFYW